MNIDKRGAHNLLEAMAMPTSRKRNEGKNSSRGKNLAMHKPPAI